MWIVFFRVHKTDDASSKVSQLKKTAHVTSLFQEIYDIFPMILFSSDTCLLYLTSYTPIQEVTTQSLQILDKAFSGSVSSNTDNDSSHYDGRLHSQINLIPTLSGPNWAKESELVSLFESDYAEDVYKAGLSESSDWSF